jgi:hypothetical protein
MQLVANLLFKLQHPKNQLPINLNLIARYVVTELRLLKFLLESYLLGNSTRAHYSSQLLLFFKKNCFLRDYVYFWQSRAAVIADQIDGTSPLLARFIIHTDLPQERVSLDNEAKAPYGHTNSQLKHAHTLAYYRTLLTKGTHNLLSTVYRSFSFGFMYIQGLTFILFIDACLTDDEPLWEPIEWSLVQSWLLFIFAFAWIAENLIVSRYGSYTGRDKRVWFSWYKTFWLIEGYYAINYGVACVFVIVPFYFETNYSLSFVYSWWHWYSRVFFFKFISVFTIILFISYYLQMSVRWLNWRKGIVLVVIINIFLSYLIYTQFIMTFFGYFTDPVWYQKTRPVDYIQLSHEPARWGWGSAKKDHFTYHNVKTVFWFKNDGPFASSFLLFQTFLFVCIFLLYIYWLTLLRRIYAMKEIPLTYTTYCVSSLKQFFYFFLMFYIMVFFSYIFNYSRFPIEFLWGLDTQSWWGNFATILLDYPTFLLSIIGC